MGASVNLDRITRTFSSDAAYCDDLFLSDDREHAAAIRDKSRLSALLTNNGKMIRVAPCHDVYENLAEGSSITCSTERLGG